MHDITVTFLDGNTAQYRGVTRVELIMRLANHGKVPAKVMIDGVELSHAELRQLTRQVNTLHAAMRGRRPEAQECFEAIQREAQELCRQQEAVTPAIERKIRTAWVAGVLQGVAGAFFGLRDIVSGAHDGIWFLVIVGLILALAYGVFKHSRTCAIMLFSFNLILNLLVLLSALDSGQASTAGGIIMAVAFALLVCYFMGVVGTIQYHRRKRASTPGQRLHTVAHTGRRLLASFHLGRLIQGLCVLLLVAGVGLLCLTPGGLLNKTLPQDCLAFKDNPNWGIIYARLSCHNRAYFELGNAGPVAGLTLVGLGALGLLWTYAKK